MTLLKHIARDTLALPLVGVCLLVLGLVCVLNWVDVKLWGKA